MVVRIAGPSTSELSEVMGERVTFVANTAWGLTTKYTRLYYEIPAEISKHVSQSVRNQTATTCLRHEKLKSLTSICRESRLIVTTRVLYSCTDRYFHKIHR